VQVNREGTEFSVLRKIDSTTEPPAPTYQATGSERVDLPPIGRGAARWLGHPVATPQAQQSIYESKIHASNA
jgi:hypothetical protein